MGASGAWQGLYAEAVGHFTRALAISQRTDDLSCQSRSLHNLALAEPMNALADVLVATGNVSAAGEVRARLSSRPSLPTFRVEANDRPGVRADDDD